MGQRHRATLITNPGRLLNSGQPVFRSEVISTIQAVEGVAFVNLLNFDSTPETVTLPELAGLAGSLQLLDTVPAELARADGGSNRIVPAELVYLTPSIPETLILTEVK